MLGDQDVWGTNRLSKAESILGTGMSQNLSRGRRHACNWGPLLYAEPKEHDLIAVHSGSSSLISRIQWHRLWGQFHTKRRRSKIKVRYSHAECRHIAKNLTRSERAMRGPDIHQDTLFSTASPAGRVPKDHPLRQLVDMALLALDEDFDDLYADAANGS